jgi:hypothetical protein
MTTLTIKAHLIWSKYEWQDEPTIYLNQCEYEDENHVTLGEYEVEVEIPPQMDINTKLIANIRNLKKSLAAETQKRQTEYDTQIQNLLALPHES